MSIFIFNKVHFYTSRIKHHSDEFLNTLGGNSFNKYSEHFNKLMTSYSVGIYLFKVNYGYTRTMCEILPKLKNIDTRTKMKQESYLRKDFTYCPSISFFDFEQINVCRVLLFLWFRTYNNYRKTWCEGINNHF